MDKMKDWGADGGELNPFYKTFLLIESWFKLFKGNSGKYMATRTG